MDGPDKLRVLFFYRAMLITQLREDFRKGGQPDPKLGLERQYYKGQIRCARQRAEILERVRKGGASGTQRQAPAPARTVHFLQSNTHCRKLGKIEAFIQIIGWIIFNVIIQTSEIEDGIEAIPSHHFFK